MRGTLRDYSSGKHCNIYVFSKTQAEYLSQRLGGAPIIKMKTDIKLIGRVLLILGLMFSNSTKVLGQEFELSNYKNH